MFRIVCGLTACGWALHQPREVNGDVHCVVRTSDSKSIVVGLLMLLVDEGDRGSPESQPSGVVRKYSCKSIELRGLLGSSRSYVMPYRQV